MYKLGNNPSPNSDITEIADFLEISCFLSDEKRFSIQEARSVLSVESDELDNEGIISDDDRIIARLEETLQLIDNRRVEAGNRYPFIVEMNSLSYHPEIEHAMYYIYLLFATRADMIRNKIQQGIDGTELFEHLSAVTIKNYFGDRAKQIVFGTGNAERVSFRARIEDLIKQLGSNGNYKEPVGDNGHTQDGSVDVIAWIPLHDKRDSFLLALGQCKTGYSWKDSVGKLKPQTFFPLYSTYTPYLDPFSMFFVAESVRTNWERLSRGVLFFDRCRIMDFLPINVPAELEQNIDRWLTSLIQNRNN
jgi:hypothetical protein